MRAIWAILPTHGLPATKFEAAKINRISSRKMVSNYIRICAWAKKSTDDSFVSDFNFVDDYNQFLFFPCAWKYLTRVKIKSPLLPI